MGIEFFVTSIIVVVSPGTGVLYTVAAGLARGPRASIVAAVGCTLGIVPHIGAAVFGVTTVVHASSVAFEALRIGGVAYLLYLAWSTLRERGALDVTLEPGPRSSLRTVVQAILINILNPKLSLFFFAFLPQFVGPNDKDALPRMLEMSAAFMFITLVIFIAYGLAASAMRAHVLRRPNVVVWIRRTFAAAFIALGLRLVTSER